MTCRLQQYNDHGAGTMQHASRARRGVGLTVAVMVVLVVANVAGAEPVESSSIRLRLTVTTPLKYANTPLDPQIDFPEFLRAAGVGGVLDPNSIECKNVATGEIVPHALSEDFAYTDVGRVEFVVADPGHTEFEIRFRAVPQRPPLAAQRMTPQIGIGDLLRYNAKEPRPIALPFMAGLHDLNGDGKLDLTGTWNYAYRPGWPESGAICYPRADAHGFRFGDLVRLRHVRGSRTPQFLSDTYMASDFADFNDDGKLDMVITRQSVRAAEFYLQTGQRDAAGMPRFELAATVNVPGWEACRAVDLDGDKATDLVVGGQYVRNQNPAGWPFRAAQAVNLSAGKNPCFLDVNHDGRLDAVCLQPHPSAQSGFYRLAWRANLGGTPPRFGDEQRLGGIDLAEISQVAAWSDGARSGLIVQHAAFQALSFFEKRAGELQRVGRAESNAAVMSLGDQAWPCLCDWDDDGDQDLLVGGGYGWPRIVINDGNNRHPAYREPERILADGKPIRFVRNEILGPPANWHDMGYSYPDFVDWDGDGLRDLVFPNETNRIFWYRNQGTSGRPRFGSRQQILCDGFPDSKELRSLSAKRALDQQSNNGVYPYEAERPFMWRTGAAVADLNGDQLMDLVTHDGHQRLATLFVQYRDEGGTLRLRKDRVLRLKDGRPIDDAIVSRSAHWTESFRAVDWDADGLQDLLYSVAGAHRGTKDGGSIYLLRNIGTKTEPIFANPTTMCCFGEPIRITNHGPHPWPGDFDGDGKPDLVACVEWSVYPFYGHAALMMAKRPEYVLELRAD